MVRDDKRRGVAQVGVVAGWETDPRFALSKITLQRPDFERSGPGLALETWDSPRKSVLPKHPGLKIETWATHTTFVRVAFR